MGDLTDEDGNCLLDLKPCNHTPFGDCDNCNSHKEYILETTGAEE